MSYGARPRFNWHPACSEFFPKSTVALVCCVARARKAELIVGARGVVTAVHFKILSTAYRIEDVNLLPQTEEHFVSTIRASFTRRAQQAVSK